MNSKIHWCGYCGQPTNSRGIPLEGESLIKACRILEVYGDYRTHQEHGECCVYQEMQRQAIDVGMPEIEGMRIK